MTDVTHSDPPGGYGYDGGDTFGRAFDALRRAESRRDYEARCLADVVVDNSPLRDYLKVCYRRARAAQRYADAVYEQVVVDQGYRKVDA